MVRDQFGVWSLFLPDDKFGEKFVHGSKLKVHVVTETGSMDRIPAYIRRVCRRRGHWGSQASIGTRPSRISLRIRFQRCRAGCVCTKHTLAWHRRREGRTYDEFTEIFCRGSPNWATTPSSSWRSWSTRITGRLDITSAASSPSLSLRHTREFETADRHRPRNGHSYSAGYRSQPCGEKIRTRG